MKVIKISDQIVLMGDGEVLKIINFREFVNDDDGVPYIEFTFLIDERIKLLYNVDDVDGRGYVKRKYIKIYLRSFNSSKSIWLCTRTFDNKPSTNMSHLFADEDEALIGLYRGGLKLDKAISWVHAKSEGILSHPHQSMLDEVNLRKIALLSRGRKDPELPQNTINQQN